jgi:hypothetical protein
MPVTVPRDRSTVSNGRNRMNQYAIFRRAGWRSAEQLQAAVARSIEEAGRGDRLRWIRSYVLEEAAGFGMVCFYEAVSADALRQHGVAAGLPCDEVVEVNAVLVGSAEQVPA